MEPVRKWIPILALLFYFQCTLASTLRGHQFHSLDDSAALLQVEPKCGPQGGFTITIAGDMTFPEKDVNATDVGEGIVCNGGKPACRFAQDVHVCGVETTDKSKTGGESENYRSFECLAPNLPPWQQPTNGRVPVDITFDGIDYSNEHANLIYYGILHHSPLADISEGGSTVELEMKGFEECGFPFEYATCGFGHIQQNATIDRHDKRIRCVAPPDPGLSVVRFEVAIDGHWTVTDKEFVYYYLDDIHPHVGALEGHTPVVFRGMNLDAVHFNNDALCRFDSVAVRAQANYRTNEIVCFSPPAFEAGQIEVTIALNGEDFVTTPLYFVYYEITKMTPPFGPNFGGSHVYFEVVPDYTVKYAYEEHVYCLFDRDQVDGGITEEGRIYCKVPPLSDEEFLTLGQHLVTVHVSLNGEDVQTAPGDFKYFDVDSIHPELGPTTGGTLVTLRGDLITAFDEHEIDPKCKILDEIIPATVDWDRQEITCESPSGHGDPVINFSMYGDDFAPTPHEFHYYELDSCSPAIGPESGGTRVAFKGPNFRDGGHDHIRCKFNDVTVKGRYDRSIGAAVCISPAGQSFAELAISLNGGHDFTSFPSDFDFYYMDAPVFDPPFLPAAVAGNVTIKLQLNDQTELVARADGSEHPKCMFGQLEVSGTWNATSAEISCSIPPSELKTIGGQSVQSGVAIHGTDFGWAEEPYRFWDIIDVSPDRGSPEGGTAITVVLSGLSDFDTALIPGKGYCKFGNHEVLGVVDASVPAIKCTTPAGTGAAPLQFALGDTTLWSVSDHRFYYDSE